MKQEEDLWTRYHNIAMRCLHHSRHYDSNQPTADAIMWRYWWGHYLKMTRICDKVW